MPRKAKEIKITYICKPYDEMTPKEKLESDARLADAFNFIFEKTLERLASEVPGLKD
jgi:hypothetical protein